MADEPLADQARALILTGPDDIRTRFTSHGPADLAADLAALRPRPGSMVRHRTLLAMREPGRRAQFPRWRRMPSSRRHACTPGRPP